MGSSMTVRPLAGRHCTCTLINWSVLRQQARERGEETGSDDDDDKEGDDEEVVDIEWDDLESEDTLIGICSSV